MAKSKETNPVIITNQPKYNDISAYQYSTTHYSNPEYGDDRNEGLPENNDKFSEKDLYTNSKGHMLNEEIMFQNIKFEGDSYIRIDDCYINHTGVNYKVIDISVRCYLFSKTAAAGSSLDPDTASYNTLYNKLVKGGAPMKYSELFVKSYSDRKSDVGRIFSNTIIVSNLDQTVQLGDFDGLDDEFSPGAALAKINTEGESITVIDETQQNNLYFVVYMKGNADLPWPRGSATRKRKFQIFEINNLDLFNDDGSGRLNDPISFTDGTSRIVSGGGDGGTDAPAWECNSFQITVDTRGGVADQSVLKGSRQYKRFVKPSIPFYETNPLSYLQQTPERALFNDEFEFNFAIDGQTNITLPRDGYPNAATKGFADYFPLAFVTPMDDDEPLSTGFDNYYDLQRYHKTEDGRLIASAPTTVALSFSCRSIPHFTEREGSFGVPITASWNNWPELPMDDQLDAGSGSALAIPSYAYGGNSKHLDRMFYYYVLDWDDKDDKIQTWDDAFKSTPTNRAELLKQQNENKYHFKTFKNVQNFGQTISASMITHTYNTPGIKTIKAIMVSYNRQPFENDEVVEDPDDLQYQGGPFETGRWKLITTRFFLDIPINQTPDFVELGGNYITLPWPYPTPIIGGISEDSKYKKSIRTILSSGKIGKSDIIDERFLLNDINNEEMGKNILNFDLEQCRYFDKSYSLDSLLMLDKSRTGVGTRQYLTTEEHLETLEGFNGNGMNNAEVMLLNAVGWDNYGRPDIALFQQTIDMENEVQSEDSGTEFTDEGEQLFGGSGGTGGGPGDGAMPTAGQGMGPGMGPGDGGGDELMGFGDGAGGDFECFVAGTKIRMKSGLEKNIEDIQIGEEVLSYNIHTKKLESKKVTKLFTQVHDLVDGDITAKTKFNNGIITHNTIANPFWSKDKGFVAADAERCNRLHQWVKQTNKGKDTEQLEVGDTLYYHNGEELEEVMVTDIENILEPDVRTYDITIEDNHTFFANGILTHNSGGEFDVPNPGEGETDTGEDPGEDANFYSITFSDTVVEPPVVQNNKIYRNHGFGNEQEPSTVHIRWKLHGYGSHHDEGNYNPNVMGDDDEMGEYQQAIVRIYLMKRTGNGNEVEHFSSGIDFGYGGGNSLTILYEGFGLMTNGEYHTDWTIPYEGIPSGDYTLLIHDTTHHNIDNDNELVDVEVVMYGEFTVRQFINPPQPEEPRPLETFANPISWIVAATLENKYTDTDFWDGSTLARTFPHESSVGQIFINENQDNDLKAKCKIELNSGELTGKAIYDSSGNGKKGIIIGDYKIKKQKKGQPMRKDSSLKLPIKGHKNEGAM